MLDNGKTFGFSYSNYAANLLDNFMWQKYFISGKCKYHVSFEEKGFSFLHYLYLYLFVFSEFYTCFSSQLIKTSKKGAPCLSVACKIVAGFSMAEEMLTNSLHISSANTEASVRSIARSFSCKQRSWIFTPSFVYTYIHAYSSEIEGLCLIKWPSQTLGNLLLHFWNIKNLCSFYYVSLLFFPPIYDECSSLYLQRPIFEVFC